jgi:ADP-ribose pyrophosphatase YjhB (NUDIX family)
MEWRVIDEEWQRPPAAEPSGVNVRVAAVVPLPSDLGGTGEVLGLYAFGSLKLPVGDVRSGESIRAAASRAVLGMTGLSATPERLVYIVEQVGKQLTLCVLCVPREGEDVPERPGIRFVPPASVDDLDPPAIRELLIEDAASGFVRPVAFVTVGFDETGQERATVVW